MRGTSLRHTMLFITFMAIAIGTQQPFVSAQTTSAVSVVGQLPDVVGFRPGISIQEGYAKLKAYDARAKVDVDNVTIPQIGDRPIPTSLTLSESGPDQSPEALQLGITLPPNPQVVWRVARQLMAPPGKEMSRTNLMTALRQKYGPETYIDRNDAPYNVVWLFDEQGNRVHAISSPSPCALDPVVANTIGLGMAILSHFPAHPNGWDEKCNSLVFVKAYFKFDSARGPEYINWMAVSIGDSGLAARAANNTATYIANENAQKKKQGLKKLQQQPAPKF